MFKVVYHSNTSKGPFRTTTQTIVKTGSSSLEVEWFNFSFWGKPTANLCAKHEQVQLKDASSMLLTHK